jgi:hypothetical protein
MKKFLKSLVILSTIVSIPLSLHAQGRFVNKPQDSSPALTNPVIHVDNKYYQRTYPIDIYLTAKATKKVITKDVRVNTVQDDLFHFHGDMAFFINQSDEVITNESDKNVLITYKFDNMEDGHYQYHVTLQGNKIVGQKDLGDIEFSVVDKFTDLQKVRGALLKVYMKPEYNFYNSKSLKCLSLKDEQFLQNGQKLFEFTLNDISCDHELLKFVDNKNNKYILYVNFK